MDWKPPSLPWGEGGLRCLSSDFLRGPLLAFRDCENYQSETENGSDENKPCFNLRTFVGVKRRVLFHLEHKIHLLHGNAACLSPTLRPQREATILESHFSLLSSFLFWGKRKCWLFVRNRVSTCITSIPQKAGCCFCFVCSMFWEMPWVCCLELCH